MEWDNFDSNEDDDFLQEDEDNVDESNVVFQPQNHQILTEKDIHQLQEDDITKVSDFLSVSRVSASILLRHFHWNTDIVGDKWVEDEDGICQTVGLLRKKVVPSDLTCGICFDLCSREKIYSSDCGHPFCSECWAGYFSTSINEGPGCLMLRCPDPSCKVSVGDDLINTLASEEDKKKYHRYLVRSYIEGDNKKANKTKWCPAPGCEYAVKLDDVTGSCDVTCRCSNVFCWKCTEESHRPVDCDTVAKWIFKNNDESENTNWILANSKPCPKCKRPIEKNHGCMHMTCKAPCFFEFCWLCLGSWKDHDMRVNSFYLCNGYNEAKRQGRYDEAERKKEIVKRSLDRYAHYYERWAANNASMEKALVELQKMQTELLETLNKIFDKPVTELEFITKAWQQIVGCRRVLKWTYALGYYLLEHNDAKKHFFEYMQGEAEAGLEKLHHCAEKELEKFLSRDAVLQEFEEFSTKLKGLTAVTRIQFEKVVEALENGLSDVNYLEESSKKRKLEPGVEERQNSGNWSCEHCTFSNISSFTDCQMCGLPNDGVAYSEDDETDEETQDDEETDE